MSAVKLPQPKAMRDTLLLSIHEAMLRDPEIFFVKELWPDFSENSFNQIISKFYKIKRNFGDIND